MRAGSRAGRTARSRAKVQPSRSASLTAADDSCNREDSCSKIFFFQAEDGIRDSSVTGVQTCALPICLCRGVGDDRARVPGDAFAALRTRRMRHYAELDEERIRAQTLVREWTRAGLLDTSQRARLDRKSVV